MLLLALLGASSSFTLGGKPHALRHTPRAAVIAHHGHAHHPLSDKFDTSAVWSEASWDKYTSDPGYSFGKYSRTSLVEAHGLEVATEPRYIVQALTSSLSEYSRESLVSRDAWLTWLPKPLLEKLWSATKALQGLSDRDEWLEGCLLEAGDDEAERALCMS